MAPALRSKKGCLTCRRRRIKCDENHPLCFRCQKSGMNCLWQDGDNVTPRHLQSIKTFGELYASLFLQPEFVQYDTRAITNAIQLCPARQISPGYPALATANEHHNLLKLSQFLSMICLPANPQTEPSFDFTVALQEPWVRNALLAFAGFVRGTKDRDSLWYSVLPYYNSAIRAVRYNIAQLLDEQQLEKLLVASLYLGLIEINNPYNEIFPLLHFEAVGKFLEVLAAMQSGRVLSVATRRFHRIALESYLYHVAIQSLYWPQIDRYTTISSGYRVNDHSIDTNPAANVIVKLDLRIYMILIKLARLARVPELNSLQKDHTTRLQEEIYLMANEATTYIGCATQKKTASEIEFHKMTYLATSTLVILSSKILDRSLSTRSLSLRPLVESSLQQLEKCVPNRAWTGDYGWVLTVLSCAVDTSDECERLSRRVRQLSTGFWGSDLKRMKQVLERVRLTRLAMLSTRNQNDEELSKMNPLDLLVEGRLSLN